MPPIALLQPLHSYPTAKGEGQIYMNTSILTVASRLRAAGADVLQIHDANLRPFTPKTDVVGINVLGAPYVPLVRNWVMRHRKDIRSILGGQVTTGFFHQDAEGIVDDRAQFDQLFGKQAVIGNVDAELATALGIDARAMSAPEKTSLIPAYEMLPDADMREYLTRELSFYLSQGCAKQCDFCAAVRTMRDPTTGEWKRVKEEYREPDIVESDLTYLMQRAAKLGIDHLDVYLTNLDLFQTRPKLKEFAGIAKSVEKNQQAVCPNFSLRMRGLSTVESFMRIHKFDPETIHAMVAAGLHTVGFGVDGWGKEQWERLHKGHNNENDCIEVMRLCREEYGITPEILMVFGHQKDTPENLEAAFNITREMVEKYGAIPRPHVSKLAPGSSDWLQQDELTIWQREWLLAHPEDFQNFDFTCAPSPLTHPDPVIRHLAEMFFWKMIALRGNTTPGIRPVFSGYDAETNEKNAEHNEGQRDR